MLENTDGAYIKERYEALKRINGNQGEEEVRLVWVSVHYM